MASIRGMEGPVWYVVKPALGAGERCICACIMLLIYYKETWVPGQGAQDRDRDTVPEKEKYFKRRRLNLSIEKFVEIN